MKKSILFFYSSSKKKATRGNCPKQSRQQIKFPMRGLLCQNVKIYGWELINDQYNGSGSEGVGDMWDVFVL